MVVFEFSNSLKLFSHKFCGRKIAKFTHCGTMSHKRLFRQITYILTSLSTFTKFLLKIQYCPQCDLREINFGQFEKVKHCHFDIFSSASLDYEFLLLFEIFKCEIPQKIKIQSLLNC